jgi:hypothetical protein
MPDGRHTELQQCALPGCAETIVQPKYGGPRRLYCSHDHRSIARRMRSVARETETVPPRRPVPPQERGPGAPAPWMIDPFSLPPDAGLRGSTDRLRT